MSTSLNYKEIEDRLSLKFKNRELLKNAFIHRSYLNEGNGWKLGSNERLEFLGDACLELCVSEFLYHKYPKEPEGVLTNYRSALVNTGSLAETAKNLNLGNYLLLSKGEEDSGGRESQYLLANCFEALLGAIYLEHGFAKVYEFLRKILFPKIHHIIENRLYQDPKSYLQEIVQEKMLVTPHYKILKEEGPDHNKIFTVAVMAGKRGLGQGSGASKQKAETEAAKDALEKNPKIW